MGLGRFGGGTTVTRWLTEQLAKVTVTDLADESELAESLEKIKDLDVKLSLGSHRLEDLENCDLVIVNPAVNKSKSSFFKAVVERSIPWTTEINLFIQRCKARIVGVTGSLGKSTTVAMLEHILRFHAEKRIGNDPKGCRGQSTFNRVYLGGNIGRSLLAELDAMTADDVAILELSSFQLEDLPIAGVSPAIAAVTNIVPHHLDRHGTFDAYFAAKSNMARFQDKSGRIILGNSAEQWRQSFQSMADQTGAAVESAPIRSLPTLKSLGAHNRENASLAVTIAATLGVSDESAMEALRTYKDLPHRLEVIPTNDGLRWINDSKSSTPAATITALKATGRADILIMGGQESGADLSQAVEHITACCGLLITYGENARRIQQVLFDNSHPEARQEIKSLGADTLSQACQLARQTALPAQTILFSPGAPSYDQFQNFEKRGEAFTRFVTGRQ